MTETKPIENLINEYSKNGNSNFLVQNVTKDFFKQLDRMGKPSLQEDH